MSSLRGWCRRSRKLSVNPYAGRGLDKFVLVSAELQAKREELAEQLETPLSMVKFAIGSHNRWIPIVFSRSRKKGGHASKKKSGGMATEDKSTHKGGLHSDCKAIQAASLIENDEDHVRREENLINEAQRGGNRANLGDQIDAQSTQFSGFSSGITASSGTEYSLDGQTQEDQTLLGSLLRLQRSNLDEIIEILPAEANGLQARDAKSLVGASWLASKASAFARNVVLLKWRTKSTQKRTSASAKRPPRLPEKEILDDARTPRTSSALPSASSLKQTPSTSPYPAQSLSLPLPPSRIKTASSNKTTDEAAIVEIMENASISSKGKRQRKGKCNSLLNICSAPSTPRNSRKPQKPFTGASTLPQTASGLNDQAAHTDVKEERLVAHKSTSPLHVLSTSRFSRALMAKKERARRSGQALAATGLLLSLIGIILGYFPAILGVVCWWYLLPGLRKAVGDKPVVRSHLHTHDTSNNFNNIHSLNVQLKSNKGIQEAGSGNFDLQSLEYRKKVIMEGFLDRGRRSNA